MKRVLIIIMSLALSASMFSQETTTDYKKFKFGFKVDPNLSWMSPKTNEMTNEGVLGRASFGLNADIMFSENYAFGTGINVMKNGGFMTFLDNEIRDNDPNLYIVLRERKYKLNYVEVPLTIKLRTAEIGYITYWGQFGLGLGFTIAANAEDKLDFLFQQDPTSGLWDQSSKDQVEESLPDIIDEIVPVRASMIVAGGIEYALSGNTSAILGITYNNGFTNVLEGTGIERDDEGLPVFESGDATSPREFDLKSISNHFQVTLGILF